MNAYYAESKESLTLMRLNKICKDEYFAYLYKNRKIKNLCIRIRYIFQSLCLMHRDGLAKSFLKIVWSIFQSRIKNYELTYDRDDEEEFKPTENVNFTKMPKIVVYTSVFGNYDKINEPLYKNPYIDYVAITDQNLQSNSVWQKYDTALIPDFSQLDAYHKAKFCKVFPHKLFPNYDYSIWVDGNVQIVADVFPLVLKMNQRFIATYRNPLHDDIYTEGRFCVYCNAVNLRNIKRQLRTYKKDGFPTHFGMREFSIIVRHHNVDSCISLMEQWWNQLNTYTMRDQISFPYLLWKNHLNIDIIQLLGDNWRHNPRFVAKSHSKKHSM